MEYYKIRNWIKGKKWRHTSVKYRLKYNLWLSRYFRLNNHFLSTAEKKSVTLLLQVIVILQLTYLKCVAAHFQI